MPKDYQPKKIIISYRTKGSAPLNAKYFLIETDKGLAILEQVENGKSALINAHWRDIQGDHFAGWKSLLDIKSTALEFVIPLDRSKAAKKFVYPEGTYAILKVNGVSMPVPNYPRTKPDTWLIPMQGKEQKEK